MIHRRAVLCGAGLLWGAVPKQTATILYGDRVTALADSRLESGDLWIPAAELSRVNEFTVKPQGACREDICIPLPKALKRSGWLNLSGFARKVRQPLVHEGTAWSLGEMPALRSGFLQSRQAPDFSAQNRQGKTVHLKDFRGRKILLLTWASW